MFKKGDKVYSILRGWGEVINIIANQPMSVHVEFDKGTTASYSLEGKFIIDDLYPELYHTEPVITVPKRRVEHKGWIAIDNEPYENGVRDCSMVVGEENKDQLTLKDNEYLNRTLNLITYYTEE